MQVHLSGMSYGILAYTISATENMYLFLFINTA